MHAKEDYSTPRAVRKAAVFLQYLMPVPSLSWQNIYRLPSETRKSKLVAACTQGGSEDDGGLPGSSSAMSAAGSVDNGGGGAHLAGR